MIDGDIMDIKFLNQQEWKDWLETNYQSDDGIYLIFDKMKKSSSLTQEEALDVALMYGWIDAVMNKIDDQYFRKYFKKRAKQSIWSTKNKNRVNELIKLGLMKPSGLNAVEISKANGKWDQGDSLPDDYDVDVFKNYIRLSNSQAFEDFNRFSPSVQKTYAISYFVLKKPESRIKRLNVIIERTLKHLKPMD